MSDDALFEIEPDTEEEVKQRDPYNRDRLKPWQTLMVHLQTADDRRTFSELVGQTVDADTDFIWFPQATMDGVVDSTPAFQQKREEKDQPILFDAEEVDADWKEVWRGMPNYSHADLQPEQTIFAHFLTQQDRQAFAVRVGQPLRAETKFIWHPKSEIRRAATWVYTGKQVTPRHPIYIISKSRWDSRLTQKCLEDFIHVPYHIVVEPQEVEQYAAAGIPRDKILTLPFSNLGLGGIPARNFVWEHSISIGAKRHWILDDNISGFCLFQDNLKVELDNGVTFCAAEDFVDRYENVKMAGFNYDYFAPRKQGAKIRPYTFNTRIYSGILLSNDIPHRWRGRYNEDTDLSLRILKDGWCTVLFNAFLMYKAPTLTMKGGNTDQLYAGAEAMAATWEEHAATCKQCKECVDGYGSRTTPCAVGREILSKDGRWLMAESLREQHPDCTTVERKWRRWQHQVDYRQFEQKLGNNVLHLCPDVVIPDVDPYALTLAPMPPEDEPGRAISQPKTRSEASPANRDKPSKPSPGQPLAAPRAPSGLSLLDSLLSTTAQHAPVVMTVLESLPADEHIEALVEAAVVEVAPSPTNFSELLDEHATPDALPQLLTYFDEVGKLPFDAQFFKEYLEKKGHRLLTNGGRLFVTESSELTDAERTVFKNHRDALLAVADLPPTKQEEPARASTSLFEEPKPEMSLAQFLGSEPPRQVPNYRPDEIPNLDGVDEIILNFATNGLNWATGAKPVGVTVGTLDGQLTRFLPFAFDGGGNLDATQVTAFLRSIRGKKIYNDNTRFDIHMGKTIGVDFDEQGCTFSDIQHTAAIVDDSRGKFRKDGLKPFAIDTLALDYLPDLEKVSRVDESRHASYHAADVAERERFTVELVRRLRDVMYPELDKQDLRQVQLLEDDVIPAVVEMEENGSPLDLELLDAYHTECNKRHDDLMLEVIAECGFTFDHTATGWQKLFEKLGLPPTDGNAEAIIKGIDHPTVRKAHLASQYASLDSKTFKAYIEKIGSDGILRFDINQLKGDDGGTVSGRFSIGYVQQVPNHDNHFAVFGEDLFPRRVFVGGRMPGDAGRFEYLEADAMQIEQRLLVHYADNKRVIKEYDGDYDRLMRGEETVSYHKVTWRMMKEYKPDMLYSHQKSFNFAFQYGAKSIKLAVMMGFITQAEGEEIRRAKRWDDPRLKTIKEIEAAYKKMMPEGNALLDRAAHLAKPQCDEFCRKGDQLHRELPHRGYVKTLVGRRSRFPDSFKTYIGLNRVLQGTGADIMKKKLAELHRARRQTGFVMRLTVHDAVGGDATLPETKQRVSEILNAQSYPLKVPILWSANTGPNWAACK